MGRGGILILDKMTRKGLTGKVVPEPRPEGWAGREAGEYLGRRPRRTGTPRQGSVPLVEDSRQAGVARAGMRVELQARHREDRGEVGSLRACGRTLLWGF